MWLWICWQTNGISVEGCSWGKEPDVRGEERMALQKSRHPRAVFRERIATNPGTTSPGQDHARCGDSEGAESLCCFQDAQCPVSMMQPQPTSSLGTAHRSALVGCHPHLHCHSPSLLSFILPETLLRTARHPLLLNTQTSTENSRIKPQVLTAQFKE